MHWIDWAIVICLLAVITAAAIATKKYTRSVADFLAANRCARRYLISTSEGIAALGAISIVYAFEMHYKSGFSVFWWSMLTTVVTIIVSLSGWVVYRFRSTRALTMAQFLEMRYSKRIRIFAGLLAWFSGIINFGLFPAVGARFFIYFCNIPESVSIAVVDIPTYPLVIFLLLSISLFFVFIGGQIAVIVTDFLQGVFSYVMFVVLGIFILMVFPWAQIGEALAMAPKDASLIHPFHTTAAKDFNLWFYLIASFGIFYGTLAWQGNQGYNASALNPHEARMGKILGTWRGTPVFLIFVLLPVCAYTLMHHPEFADKANSVNSVLAGIENETIRTQVTVPVILSKLLPRGLMGGFCAVMLAAFISTHDTYLHSWGSIFIQDVVLPLRKKELSPAQHIRWLRLSILGVAVFIFCFSLFYHQNEYIAMFFAITGSIFVGGAGSVIIGGLYWKRGTTKAAWTSLIASAALSLTSIVVDQIWFSLYQERFPINSQWKFFIISLCCIILYVIVSLLGKKNMFNMDKLLHRNRYKLEQDGTEIKSKPIRGLCALIGINQEFTLVDKIIYISTVVWTLLWTTVFIIVTVYSLLFDTDVSSWLRYWQFYILLMIIVSIITSIWFTVGGLTDLKKMIGTLRVAKREIHDDGRVINE